MFNPCSGLQEMLMHICFLEGSLARRAGTRPEAVAEGRRRHLHEVLRARVRPRKDRHGQVSNER